MQRGGMAAGEQTRMLTVSRDGMPVTAPVPAIRHLSALKSVCYQGMDEAKAWQQAAELIVLLCKRHGLAVSCVVPHRHWSRKACPSRILPRWSEFVKMIEKELSTLDKHEGH
ncbi:hypothetical protein ABU162_11705 [Paenibacillus thiaminolyticus]|uniref:hypothetical protein n=1 Tax=Paenibacillus thiaminolyticus TaxID=49283 RepID=UPI0035A6B816